MLVPFGMLGERYRLLERLATGGMGVVWRALDTVLNRTVAIKLIRPECADDPTFRDRLRSEARAIAAIDNPHVVRIFDVGEEADPAGGVRSYLVMELVDGVPLSDRLHDPGPLAAPTVAAIIGQAASALAAVHARGIVHRDVKPANLLLDASGRLTIVDFGIARAADAVPLTATNTMVGTVHYLSPEQVSGQMATAASDVYALGVVAFRCLAGRLPFDGDNHIAVALAHREQPVPELPAGTPNGLAALVRQMLAKAPGERPTAADVVARAARPDDEQTPMVVAAADKPAPAVVGSSGTTQLIAATAADRAPARPSRRRRLAFLTAAGVMAIAIGSALALIISTSDSGGTHHPPAAPAVTEPSSTTPQTSHPDETRSAAGTTQHSADGNVSTQQAAVTSHKSARRTVTHNPKRSLPKQTSKPKSRPKPRPKPSPPKQKSKPTPKPKPTHKPKPHPTPTATPTPRLTPTPTMTVTPTPTASQ